MFDGKSIEMDRSGSVCTDDPQKHPRTRLSQNMGDIDDISDEKLIETKPTVTAAGVIDEGTRPVTSEVPKNASRITLARIQLGSENRRYARSSFKQLRNVSLGRRPITSLG